MLNQPPHGLQPWSISFLVLKNTWSYGLRLHELLNFRWFLAQPLWIFCSAIKD
jgi:hypothetical protein